MFIAEDIAAFRQRFADQLVDMLDGGGLGAFILVLANSLQDETLRARLLPLLQRRFQVLRDDFQANRLSATEDDKAVFRQLLAHDLSDFGVWKTDTEAGWEIVQNPIRALRPARASSERLSSIFKPFDPRAFHFNKPFLEPEIFWEGEYQSLRLRVLYNKFPFSPCHLLVVVSPGDGLAQYLDEQTHAFMFSLVTRIQTRLPGFSLGYNSLAAGASVNHLHFQGFIREGPLPIEQACWRHHGGSRHYPLECRVFSSAAHAWQAIEALHRQDRAYNGLYRDGKMYLVERKMQGERVLPDWLQGAGWLDVCGVMTVSGESDRARIDASRIEAGLRMLRCDETVV